jgi:hypothetical protein
MAETDPAETYAVQARATLRRPMDMDVLAGVLDAVGLPLLPWQERALVHWLTCTCQLPLFRGRKGNLLHESTCPLVVDGVQP